MKRLRNLAAGLLLAVGGLAAGPALADCSALHARLGAAMANPQEPDLKALRDAILAEPTCDAGYRARVGRSMARVLLTGLDRDAAPAELEGLLAYGRPWQVLVALGDAYFDREDWANAVRVYEEALDDMRNVTLNPKAPPEDIERQVYSRAVEARALAPTFVATRAFRGKKTGLASPEFRNFTASSVPVPVRFEFDSDRLTSDGVAAVEDMFAYLKDAYPDYVAIVGHTDPKGSEAYNDDLSLRRAKTVANQLVKLGYYGQIQVIGRGEREPFKPDDASKYSEPQLHAFDRRVEYRFTQ